MARLGKQPCQGPLSFELISGYSAGCFYKARNGAPQLMCFREGDAGAYVFARAAPAKGAASF
jgi:hypothetical protein